MLFRADNDRRLIPSWFWFFFLWLPLGTLAWWFLRWFFQPSYKRTSSVEIETPRSTSVPLPLHKDDFTILKGIGEKTANALNRAGIYTFEQLGLMDLDKLVEKLKEEGVPGGRAAKWQREAVLAAAGDWDQLEQIQK